MVRISRNFEANQNNFCHKLKVKYIRTCYWLLIHVWLCFIMAQPIIMSLPVFQFLSPITLWYRLPLAWQTLKKSCQSVEHPFNQIGKISYETISRFAL